MATAASSWIRSNIANDNMNTKGLICDFEEGSDFALGRRSFKDRMFDPADVSNHSGRSSDCSLMLLMTLVGSICSKMHHPAHSNHLRESVHQ